MNTRIEATLMISAGALLSAGAHFSPNLGDYFYEVISLIAPASAEAETPPVWVVETDALDHAFNIHFLPCEDNVTARTLTHNATMTSRDDRGGYTVSIVDGELRTIEAQGEYLLEEEGDTVRIIDPDGDVAFETSRSNPTLKLGNFTHQTFGNPFLTLAAPPLPGVGATLGAQFSPVGEAMAAQLGIDIGIVVDLVIPGSGADAGGLQQYDVIVSLGDDPIDARLLTEIIDGLQPGDTVQLGLIRHGDRLSIEIELGSIPGLAPAANGFPSNHSNLDQLQKMQRMLQHQLRPRIRRAPPANGHNPDAIDASDMAPKNRSHSFPA